MNIDLDMQVWSEHQWSVRDGDAQDLRYVFQSCVRGSVKPCCSVYASKTPQECFKKENACRIDNVLIALFSLCYQIMSDVQEKALYILLKA